MLGFLQGVLVIKLSSQTRTTSTLRTKLFYQSLSQLYIVLCILRLCSHSKKYKRILSTATEFRGLYFFPRAKLTLGPTHFQI